MFEILENRRCVAIGVAHSKRDVAMACSQLALHTERIGRGAKAKFLKNGGGRPDGHLARGGLRNLISHLVHS